MMIQSVGFALGTATMTKKTGEFSFLLFFPCKTTNACWCLRCVYVEDGERLCTVLPVWRLPRAMGERGIYEQVSWHDRQSGRKQVRRGRRRVSNVKQKRETDGEGEFIAWTLSFQKKSWKFWFSYFSLIGLISAFPCLLAQVEKYQKKTWKRRS